MFQTKVVEKIKTDILYSVTFFFEKKKRAIYEKMWKNIVQRGKPQKKMWRMRIACSIPKATNTQAQFISVTHIQMHTTSSSSSCLSWS